MKLEQIKNKVAIDYGFKDYPTICDAFSKGIISIFLFTDYFNDCMLEYNDLN